MDSPSKIRFQRLMEEFASFFYYGSTVDSWVNQIIFVPFVTLQWHTTPTWIRIIGPPSSGKSAHISLLDEHELAMSIDELTPKSLMSGFRGNGEDPSKIPQFDGKVILISDESTLMEQRAEDRGIIQAVLRKAYDGKITKSFGNIREIVEARAHFNILAAATPVIDRYFQYTQALGERYVSYRMQIPNPEALTKRAFYNLMHGTVKKHDRLRKSVQHFIDKLELVDIGSFEIPDRRHSDLIICADFLARLRTHVLRDSSGRHVTTIPRQEGGSRLVQQLIQVAIALSIIQGDECVTKKQLDIVTYLALCSVPELTVYTLYTSYILTNPTDERKTWFNSKDFILNTGIGRTTVSQILEDLAILKILKIRSGSTQGGRQLEYTLSDDTLETIEALELFKNYIPPVKTKQKRIDRFRQ